MRILVGYTGFVGSNICKHMDFDMLCNSKNIAQAYYTNPKLLVYSGVRGTKFLANSFPEDDARNIDDAINNIQKINPQKLVLISTVDVYDDLNQKDETYVSDINNLCIYGKHRFILEKWVQENVRDYHIIRIPALYGDNLKKNFVHDLIDPVPLYISQDNIFKISAEFSEIETYYTKQKGIYHLSKRDSLLETFFRFSKYNSIYFTDSRAEYQFFNLKNLALIIMRIIGSEISVLNVVSEPISAGELYYQIFNKTLVNHISDKPIRYNLTTCRNGDEKYLYGKEYVIEDLKKYILQEINNMH